MNQIVKAYFREKNNKGVLGLALNNLFNTSHGKLVLLKYVFLFLLLNVPGELTSCLLRNQIHWSRAALFEKAVGDSTKENSLKKSLLLFIMAENENIDYLFKIIIIGDQAVGKTNILNRFINNTFSHEYQCTLAVDFHSMNLSIQN